MKTKKDIAADITFLLVLAFIVIALAVDGIGTSIANASQEPTSEPTAAFYEEVITEPTEEETKAEEVTEVVSLYDVPLSPSLQEHIIKKADEHGIDPAIIVAMCWKESTYKHDAIGDNGNSYGLLQVQPKWHYGRMQKLGCTDLLDPYQNVTVAVDYLCELLNRYGSIDKALTAYNQGHYNGTITNYAKTVLTYAEGLVK